MTTWGLPLQSLWLILVAIGGMAWGQAVPDAPAAPTCAWDGSGLRSTCKFKDALRGTPTSVAGNRVILYNRAINGGHAQSRTFLADALKRLAARYGFTATITEDPVIFTAANLANTKVVIMSNGDGDVVPTGANRTALQNFQLVNGWGVMWIHAACAFVTSGWPWALENCVQQFYDHNPIGSQRRVFADSGTAASPNHGIRNPQSEFLMRSLPGWSANRTFAMGDEYYCFQAPARNTQGVNVLLGYDRSSGLPVSRCPNPFEAGTAGSQNHNLAWTRSMGKGIALYNSIGHDVGTYTSGANMGDSLLWRFIRFAAKDWCVAGSGDPGCDGPLTVFRNAGIGGEIAFGASNHFLTLNDPGPHRVAVHDVAGKKVFSGAAQGPGKAGIPGLRSGIHFVTVSSAKGSATRRIVVPPSAWSF